MPSPSNKLLTFKQRILQSSFWTLVGNGVNQALRLGGNLILTRLLFPEAFGIMAIIQAVGFGVHMLTDVGVGASIVQKEHGNSPVFLNTAWTVQVVRGFLAWAILCALAVPMSHMYAEPLLVSLIPIVGLTAIINGFNSTKLHTAQRNLEAARVTQIEIGSSVLGLISTIVLAWSLKSVWALVWGSLITAFLQLFASHLALHGIKNQFAWDRDALHHLRGFGRWIMLSSGLTFLSVEGARLLIGAMLDMRQLALYTLASTMSLVVWQALQQLAWRVFFPAYSEVYRENPDNLSQVLLKSRLALMLPSWLLALFFVFFGTQFMDTLYDERYHDSGSMLELLAAGSLIGCVWGSYVGVLLAMGKVVSSVIMTAIQIACQFGAIYLGYVFLGGAGIVVGVAAASWILYPVNAFVMYRNGLWQPKIDSLFIVASVLVVVFAWPRLAGLG